MNENLTLKQGPDKEPVKYFVRLNKQEFDAGRYEIEEIVKAKDIMQDEIYAPCSPALCQHLDMLGAVLLSSIPINKIVFTQLVDPPGSPLIAELKSDVERRTVSRDD